MNEAPGYRPGPEKQFVVEENAGDLAAKPDGTGETWTQVRLVSWTAVWIWGIYFDWTTKTF